MFSEDSAGNVAIEMAFLMTFLILLVLGAYDFGRWATEQATITQAARAGAQWAVLDQANATDTAGMIQAARDEADDANNELVIPPPLNYCQCPGSSTQVSCTTDCADGLYPPMYVQVTVQDTFELLFDFPGVDQSQALSSTSTMRVR
jgi:hypothetical protein